MGTASLIGCQYFSGADSDSHGYETYRYDCDICYEYGYCDSDYCPGSSVYLDGDGYGDVDDGYGDGGDDGDSSDGLLCDSYISYRSEEVPHACRAASTRLAPKDRRAPPSVPRAQRGLNSQRCPSSARPAASTSTNG